MRLYLSKKEANLIKAALAMEMCNMTIEQKSIATAVLDRIALCDKLQKSEDIAKSRA